MSELVTPTVEEALTILDEAMKLAGGQETPELPTAQRLKATAGVVNVVHALQALGWRVARPLTVVPPAPKQG